MAGEVTIFVCVACFYILAWGWLSDIVAFVFSFLFLGARACFENLFWISIIHWALFIFYGFLDSAFLYLPEMSKYLVCCVYMYTYIYIYTFSVVYKKEMPLHCFKMGLESIYSKWPQVWLSRCICSVMYFIYIRGDFEVGERRAPSASLLNQKRKYRFPSTLLSSWLSSIVIKDRSTGETQIINLSTSCLCGRYPVNVSDTLIETNSPV